MKRIHHLTLLLWLCSYSLLSAQNIVVDSQSFTPEQLIKDVLINSSCIENVAVTNVVGGDFGGTDQSYGFFDATGTGFPFESGLVLSTGRLQNVQGPNTSLSDDNAPDWFGDQDLEAALNETGTTNATILEFDFSTDASEVSFRYLFASEEYQEGDANTCRFSDLFGFLIKPETEQTFTNIALVPNTNTPVKVTTVHPEIPGGCEAENEFYFDRFNDANAPINFNGQTAVLTATASIVPNVIYNVKLVIADEQNFRFDSAVFLEASSLQLSTDLGENKLLSTQTNLCPLETTMLDATAPGINTYRWFKNDILLPLETDATYEVQDAGSYAVEIDLESGCTSYGEIVIEYGANPQQLNTRLQQCDLDTDGLTIFNLTDAINDLTGSDARFIVENFYTDPTMAAMNMDPITNPEAFENTEINQTVFARVENQSVCFTISEVVLSVANASLTIPDQIGCDDDGDGFATFNLAETSGNLQSLIPSGSRIVYYKTDSDALFESNPLNGSHTNSTAFTDEIIYARITSGADCFAISEVPLVISEVAILPEDMELYYCAGSFPSTIDLTAGTNSFLELSYSWTFENVTRPELDATIVINEGGTYSVTATTTAGCTSSRSFTVLVSEQATITDISIDDGKTKNTILVTVSGAGDYEYALDNSTGFYQDSATFTDVRPGDHTVYVRDRNGCGITSQAIQVLGFPEYFTPNGDGFHDTWNVLGLGPASASVLEFRIFNRYGKVLFSQASATSGWDGTYAGQPLPAGGYWYVVVLDDGRRFKGSLALKR